jgi:hypothetical protein
MKRVLAIVLTMAMVCSLLTGVAGVRAADLGMHVTSPIGGGTITTSTFTVNGTFDTAQSNNFKLLVTVAGFAAKAYNFTVAGATTWSVLVNMADFPGMVNGTAYATTLQGATAMPSIPPVQTDPTAITWNVGTIVPPVTTMTGSITDSSKVLTLNYFNPVPVPPTAGTPVALASQYIYKMGDVIHGTVTFASVTAGQLYTVQLKNMSGAVIDTVNGYQVAGLTTYPIQIGTANVSFDGPYDVVVGDANESISLPVGKHVYIQYNLTWKTKVINSCSGFNTIEGWITRGNGQTVLVPVTVGITYPDNTLAASYVSVLWAVLADLPGQPCHPDRQLPRVHA